MKIWLPLLLLFTLLVHGILFSIGRKTHQRELAEAERQAAVATAEATEARSEAAAAATTLQEMAAQATWERWNNTGDLSDLVEKLREAGFPPRVIASIALEHKRADLAAQLDAIAAEVGPMEYWRPGEAHFLPGLAREHQRLLDQARAEVVALLGEAALDDPFRTAIDQRRFGDLPAEAIRRVRSITDDYADLRAAVYMKAGGMVLPEDREQLAFLQAEEMRDLAEVMSPEQLFDYRLRNDQSAQMLRSRLGILDLTEEEYRRVYAAQLELEAAGDQSLFVFTGPPDPAARQALTEALDGELPPERLELLDQALNPMHMGINNIIARYDLDPGVAAASDRIRDESFQRFNELNQDVSRSPDEKLADYEVLRTQAREQLTELLGQPGFDAYRALGGQWVEFLGRPPGSPPSG